MKKNDSINIRMVGNGFTVVPDFSNDFSREPRLCGVAMHESEMLVFNDLSHLIAFLRDHFPPEPEHGLAYLNEVKQ